MDTLRKKYTKSARKDPAKTMNVAEDHLRRGLITEGLLMLEVLHETHPDRLDILHRLGVALIQHQRFQAGVGVWKKILLRSAKEASSHSNLGVALAKSGAIDCAARQLRNAVILKPDYTFAFNNLGNCYKQSAEYHHAGAAYQKVLSIDPRNAPARWNLGIVELLMGNLESGWPHLEAGWEIGERTSRRVTDKPLWRGESLTGKTLFIRPEQGLGDAIQMARFFEGLSKKAKSLIVETATPLYKLFRNCLDNKVTFIKEGGDIPPYDLQCPLMSLPWAMNLKFSDLPGPMPYLSPSHEDCLFWEANLGVKRNRRIGLVCSGSPTHWDDQNRSLSLDHFLPLLDFPAEFHCLQKVLHEKDALWLKTEGRIRFHGELLDEFSRTAGLIAAMDLVISVDTSVAHLAAAMGKPVWLMIPWIPDYRWLLEREDTPWYPTVRLFRQPAPKDWAQVVTEVHQALLNHKTKIEG